MRIVQTAPPVILLLTLLLGAIPTTFVVPSAAQLPAILPGIELTCEQTNLEIEVYPGATRSATIYCTATNPTSYTESVRISVVAEGLAYGAPGSLNVGPSSSVDFEVTYQAPALSTPATIQTTINASVEAVNGVQYPLDASDSKSATIQVLQYGAARLEVTPTRQTLTSGGNVTFTATLSNDGNDRDTFRLTVVNEDELSNAGFTVSSANQVFEVDRFSDHTTTVMITAPTSIKNDIEFSVLFRLECDTPVPNGVTGWEDTTTLIGEKDDAAIEFVENLLEKETLTWIGAGVGGLIFVVVAVMVGIKLSRRSGGSEDFDDLFMDDEEYGDDLLNDLLNE